MPDVFTKARRSAVMSRIRGRGNKDTELRLIAVFRANGIAGWRRSVTVCVPNKEVHAKTPRRKEKPAGKIEGRSALRLRATALTAQRPPEERTRPFSVKPDFVFPRRRLAVFVDGCFWHGCPIHATWPKQNAAFWREKILGNKRRDRLVDRMLRKAGWRVVRVWEHELSKKNEARLRRRLVTLLKKTRSGP